MQLEIKYKPLADLIPYARNSRTHSEAQVKQIAASIREFGFNNPILISTGNDIVAGHGRALAAEKLGLELVPTIELGHLSDTQRRAYVIADNRLAENAGWDSEMLAIEIDELAGCGFDMDLLGFEDLSEFGINLDDKENKEGLTGPDDVPEIEKNIFQVKRGDIWQLGEHRLMCGDSTLKEDVERLVNGEKADMVFTDPPYGVGYKYNSHNDKVTNEEHESFLRKLVSQSMFCSDRIIISPGCYNLEMMINVRNDFSHIGCWTKTNAMSPGRVTHFWTWEPIFFYGKFKRKRGNDVFNYPVGKQPDTGDHSCPKPIALWQDIIENFSEPKEKILDFFLGSGTTLIACEKTGRKCYGMELDEHYCSVIIKRWQDFTGREAMRL